MLMPKHTKFRKAHRGRMKGRPLAGATIAFGEYGLQALEPAWIKSAQIEAASRAITRFIKRGGKLWILIFPDKPLIKKPVEARIGSGYGNPGVLDAVVRPGRNLVGLGTRDDGHATWPERLG